MKLVNEYTKKFARKNLNLVGIESWKQEDSADFEIDFLKTDYTPRKRVLKTERKASEVPFGSKRLRSTAFPNKL